MQRKFKQNILLEQLLDSKCWIFSERNSSHKKITSSITHPHVAPNHSLQLSFFFRYMMITELSFLCVFLEHIEVHPWIYWFECKSQSKGFIVNPHMCRYCNLEQFPGTLPFIFHPEKCQGSAVFSRVSARVDRQPRGSAVPSPAEIEEVTFWPVKHLNEDLEINGTLSLNVLPFLLGLFENTIHSQRPKNVITFSPWWLRVNYGDPTYSIKVAKKILVTLCTYFGNALVIWHHCPLFIHVHS